MKILINATNLNSGGGVQVASSFLNELINMSLDDLDIEIWASSEVQKNLKADVINSPRYKCYNLYGLNIVSVFKNRKIFDNFDVIFTIFGPCYYPIKGIHITGFAQAWITTPNNECYNSFNLKDKLKTRVGFFIKKLFFLRAKHFIVELEHVKKGLIDKGIAKNENISVVHNTISSIYLEKNTWKDIDIPKRNNIYRLGFITRDYPHKNTEYLLKVKDILLTKFNRDIDFYVTFTPSEWNAKSEEFRKKIINVGSLDVVECPSFYKKMDAVIFPSLLECFSATPLESMIMEKPLFASNRNFVKDVCKEHAHYFEPTDPNSGAAIIDEYFSKLENDSYENVKKLNLAKEYAVNFSSPKGRAEEYIKIIRQFL